MCTMIQKRRGDQWLVLIGIPCCLSVEAVQAVAPNISRANGWEEGPAGDTVGCIVIELGAEASGRLQGRPPVGTLEYRGRTLHFRDRERMRVARAYIAARVRDPRAFPEHQRFLETIPAEILKSSARGRVLKALDRLIGGVG
jgi:hypothetical protein